LNGLGTKVLPINAFCSKDGGSPRTIELGQLGITTKVLIKADVEGFESRVLAPIIKWFRDHKVIALIAEASSKYSATWPEFVSLSNQIIDLGYACYDIGNSPSRQISAEHDWLSFSILQSKRVQTIHENIQWSHDLASVGQTNLLFISKLNNLFR
jgi:hypothetical protein